MAEGKPEEALKLSRKGLQLEVAHSREVDSTVLISRYDLACLEVNAGQMTTATKDQHAVLKEKIQVCGKGNQFTLQSHEAVGILLHLQGRNEEANVPCMTFPVTSRSISRGIRTYYSISPEDWYAA